MGNGMGIIGLFLEQCRIGRKIGTISLKPNSELQVGSLIANVETT